MHTFNYQFNNNFFFILKDSGVVKKLEAHFNFQIYKDIKL